SVCSLQWNPAGQTVAGSATGVLVAAPNGMNAPNGVFLESPTTLLVADTENQVIQRWTIGNLNSGVDIAGQNRAAGAANTQFNTPVSVVVDANGNLLVADRKNNRIQSWAPGAAAGTTIAGVGASAPNNAPPLGFPSSIVLGPNGQSFFVSDFLNHKVIQYFLNGVTAPVVVAGGNGQGNTPAQLNLPRGIFFDSASNSLIIANSGSNNVIRWVLGQNIGTIIGNGVQVGNAVQILANPTGVALDSAGNLYVSNTLNDRIVLIKPGQIIGTVIIPGGAVAGAATATSLNGPTGVKLDSRGNLYVVDTGRNRVQLFTCIRVPA
ncbi:unnamed protein product, partial [Rotaria sp. Silwood2]